MLVAQNSLGPVCPVPLTVRVTWPRSTAAGSRLAATTSPSSSGTSRTARTPSSRGTRGKRHASCEADDPNRLNYTINAVEAIVENRTRKLEAKIDKLTDMIQKLLADKEQS